MVITSTGKRLRTLLLLILLSLLVACSSSESQPDYGWTIEKTRAFITQGMADSDVVGLSIALVDGERVVWSEGFGWADKENKIPAAADTVYMLGSGTKTMTTVALLRLHEAGVVSLDDPAGNYLPEFTMAGRFPDQMENLTVRRLLTHHSGIPGDIYNGMFVEEAWNEWGGSLYTDWVFGYLKDDYPSYEPGEVAIYSNMGFIVAGEIGRRRGGGGEFNEYMDRALFQPLGMNNTSLRRITENVAIGYKSGERQTALEGNGSGGATGGAYTTVKDMARFIAMIVGGGRAPGGSPFLKPQTLDMMGVGEKTVLDLNTYWQPGLGLDSMDDPPMRYAGRAWTKNGSTGDFNSFMEVLPDRKLGVIVLSNSDTASMLVYAVAREALQNAVREKYGVEPLSPELPPYESIRDSGRIAGLYMRKEGYDRITANADGTLTWTIGAQDDTPIERTLVFDGQAYRMNGRTERILFLERSWKGRDHLLMLQYGSSGTAKDRDMYGGAVVDVMREKVALPEVTPAWRARTDKPFLADNIPWNDVINWGSPLFFLVEQDGILMSWGINGKQVLGVQDDSLAFTAGMSNRADSTVRVISDGGMEKLLYSGLRGLDMADVPPIGIGDTVTDEASLFTTKWYRFTAPSSGVRVVFSIAAGGQNYRLRLFDDSMSLEAEGSGRIEEALPAAGDWYLAVSPTPDAAASFILTVTQ